MDEYIDVKIDVFEQAGQRARLRKTLTANALILEILKEFDDITADSPEKYAVYLKGVDKPLNGSETLIQLDIQPQDELVFDYVRQTIRRMLDPQQIATLREDASGKTFAIEWQPAVIGRPTNEADHNLSLAVNTQTLENGMTISRRHAQITLAEGRYFIEALAENNPVFVNGKEIAVNARREIKNGDKLMLGNRKVTLTFSTKRTAESSPRVSTPYIKPVQAAISQPVSTPIPAPVEPDRTHLAQGVSVTLVIERANQPEKVGQRLELTNYPQILGRDLFFLNGEPEVSRRHAEISLDPATQKLILTDLKSTNGVKIEGVRIEPDRPYDIGRGTRIGLGEKVVIRVDF